MNRNYEEQSSYLSMEEEKCYALVKLRVVKAVPCFLEIQRGSLD